MECGGWRARARRNLVAARWNPLFGSDGGTWVRASGMGLPVRAKTNVSREERPRSVFGNDRRRVTAESDVETGAHDVLGLLDVDESRTQSKHLRRQANQPGA